MKLLIVALVVVTAVMADDHHHDYTDPSKFADYLKDIRKSHEFQDMPLEEQTLFGKLVSAAEQGSAALTTFIKAQTFDKILHLIDYLDEDDIPHFEGYLAYHLGGTLLGKRQSGSDLFNFMKDLQLIHKIDDDLSPADLQMFYQLLYAAEHNTLKQYIEKTGYGPVLELLAQIDDDEAHDMDQLIIRHLESEASLATTGSAV